MSSLNVSRRLIIASAVPLFALLILASSTIYRNWHVSETFSRTSVLINNVKELGEVIHYMQVERGTSAGFVGSDGARMGEPMNEARLEVDKHIELFAPILAEYVQSHEHGLADHAKHLKAGIDQLSAHRESVDNLRLGGQENLKYYTSLIRDALWMGHAIAHNSGNSDLAAHIGALVNFSESKERAGLERGLVAGAIGVGSMTVEQLEQLSGFIAVQAALKEIFAAGTDDAHLDKYLEVLSTPEMTAIEPMRSYLLHAGADVPLSEIDGAEWFAVSTARIGKMREIEKMVANDISAEADAAAAEIRNAGFFWQVFLGFSCFASILVAWFMTKSVTRPLAGLTDTLQKMSNGEFQIEISGQGRRDEFGGMADAVALLKDAALERQQLESEAAAAQQQVEAERRQREEASKAESDALGHVTTTLAHGLKQLAAGNVGHRIHTPFAQHLDQIRMDFNEAVGELNSAIGTVGQSASRIGNRSSEVNSSVDELSRRIEQQAASLEETAAALEEITTTVRSSSDRAQEAGDKAATASEVAGKSSEVVGKAIEAMGRIESSSSQIGTIVGVIDEIAFQTNLLALNAGVEAARAGEAGKGFAVVAQEVRELAQRSATAAKEIQGHIATSEAEVSAGVSLVSNAGAALEEIISHVFGINEHIQSIVQSSNEQSTALAEVNTAVNELDRLTQQYSAMAEQTRNAAAGMTDESSGLNETVSHFETAEMSSSGNRSAA